MKAKPRWLDVEVVIIAVILGVVASRLDSKSGLFQADNGAGYAGF